MFKIFGGGESEREARILFGSEAQSREEKVEIRSPYDGKVVSTYPICSADDALRALEIAKLAAPAVRISPLHQRVSWLKDVAKKAKRE